MKRPNLPEGVEPCTTCKGVGCGRCHGTGRMHLAKLSVVPTTDGRGIVALWWGAPGTMQLVATTTDDRDLADITIDAAIQALTDGGLIIDDRRAK